MIVSTCFSMLLMVGSARQSQEELTQSKELAPLLWSPLTNENVVASSLPVTAQLRTVVRLDEGDYFPDVLKRQVYPPL